MKGKKFTAAEKHFNKKHEKIRKEIDAYRKYSTTLRHEKTELESKLALLQTENAQQREWIDRLLEYTELNLDDIKAACEKDKSTSSALNILEFMVQNYL